MGEHMFVISNDGKSLNSNVSIQTFEGHFGLVMESRGGANGKSNERNTDYLEALDVIVQRLQNAKVLKLHAFLVSKARDPLRFNDMNDRALYVDGSPNIDITSFEASDLRLKLGRSMQDIMNSPTRKGGNRTNRLLLEADVSKEGWVSIINGENYTTSDDKNPSIENPFDPEDEDDARETVSRSIKIRKGQPAFRKALLQAYDEKCAVTGCRIVKLLEAAHIMPYKGEKTNHITNGILLRADIHTLFDLDLLGINDDYIIKISNGLIGSEYEIFSGQTILIPAEGKQHPNKTALKKRLKDINT